VQVPPKTQGNRTNSDNSIQTNTAGLEFRDRPVRPLRHPSAGGGPYRTDPKVGKARPVAYRAANWPAVEFRPIIGTSIETVDRTAKSNMNFYTAPIIPPAGPALRFRPSVPPVGPALRNCSGFRPGHAPTRVNSRPVPIGRWSIRCTFVLEMSEPLGSAHGFQPQAAWLDCTRGRSIKRRKQRNHGHKSTYRCPRQCRLAGD